MTGTLAGLAGVSLLTVLLGFLLKGSLWMPPYLISGMRLWISSPPTKRHVG
jgi:hypothetical protein